MADQTHPSLCHEVWSEAKLAIIILMNINEDGRKIQENNYTIIIDYIAK